MCTKLVKLVFQIAATKQKVKGSNIYGVVLPLKYFFSFVFFQIKSFNIFVFQLSFEKKLKVSRQRKNFSVLVTLIGKYFDYQVSSLLRMCEFEKRTNKPILLTFSFKDLSTIAIDKNLQLVKLAAISCATVVR